MGCICKKVPDPKLDSFDFKDGDGKAGEQTTLQESHDEKKDPEPKHEDIADQTQISTTRNEPKEEPIGDKSATSGKGRKKKRSIIFN